MEINMIGIITWISTCVAVSVGIIITHSPWCLCALFIPMFAYGMVY